MGCPSFRSLMRGVFSPLACLPPFPIASGSGGYPRVSNPLRQPAGLRLEPGLGALGEEPSPGSCMCTFVYWKRREGHSSQCLSTHPAPTHQVCPPRPAGLCRLMPSLLCAHCLAVGRSQWQSEQQCLAPEPPPTHTLSASSHTPGAPMPVCLSLHLLYKNKNVFRCPVLIPYHRPWRTIAFYSSKKAAGRLPSHLLPGIRAPVCAVE